MALRSALHQAGAAALSKLLRCDPPAPGQRGRACPCGQIARYRELRSRRILTVLGEVEIVRPWYLCSGCGNGQFPFDIELDVEHKDLSPGVRRMLAMVGAEAPFDHGRRQIELLAGLSLSTKAVERTAESIGEDLVRREQQAVAQAVQLDLPVVIGPPVPILYVEMDGTGIPVVKKETLGRAGKIDGQPAHTREVKLGCAFTQTTWDKEGYAVRDPGSTTYTGAIETADEFGKRIYLEAWNRGWSRATTKSLSETGQNGSGTSPTLTSPALSRSSISIIHASTCGISPDASTPMTKLASKGGWTPTSQDWTMAKSRN